VPGEPPPAGRRRLIGDLWRLTGWLLAAGAVLGFGQALRHGRTRSGTRQVLLSAELLERAKAATGGVIHAGLLVRWVADRPALLRLRCTHLGCALEVDRAVGQIACPCHGSRFDLQGQVLRGPAAAPLEQPPAAELPGGHWVARLREP